MHTWQLSHTVHTVFGTQHMTSEGGRGTHEKTLNPEWEEMTDESRSKRALKNVISTTNSPGRKSGAAMSFVAIFGTRQVCQWLVFLSNPWQTQIQAIEIHLSTYKDLCSLTDRQQPLPPSGGPQTHGPLKKENPDMRLIQIYTSFQTSLVLLKMSYSCDKTKSCIWLDFFFLRKMNLIVRTCEVMQQISFISAGFAVDSELAAGEGCASIQHIWMLMSEDSVPPNQTPPYCQLHDQQVRSKAFKMLLCY